jgi:hypothetical protein
MKNNNGAFGQSATHRKNTLDGARVAFYRRKGQVKAQKKKPSEDNVIGFLERRGYSPRKLKVFANQI